MDVYYSRAEQRQQRNFEIAVQRTLFTKMKPLLIEKGKMGKLTKRNSRKIQIHGETVWEVLTAPLQEKRTESKSPFDRFPIIALPSFHCFFVFTEKQNV